MLASIGRIKALFLDILHIFAENDFGDIVRNRLFQLHADGAPVRTGHTPVIDQSLTRISHQDPEFAV